MRKWILLIMLHKRKAGSDKKIVYFSIQTVKEGKPHLDYENRQNVNNGYCDMWKTEGYQTVRMDSEGHVFSFQEGMVFVFDQKKNMHTDYTSVGTH